MPRKPHKPNTPNPRQRLGSEGEAAAARFLEKRGYRIAARNVRADRVEIDLVARRGTLLVFVEVKSRSSLRLGSPAEAVDARKQARLRRGARAWLLSGPLEARGHRRLRFDVVTCLRVPTAARGTTSAARVSDTDPIRCWVPRDSAAPEGAGWWIEHWQAAF